MTERLEWFAVGRLKGISSLVINFDSDIATDDGEPVWPQRDVCKAIQQAVHQAWVNKRPLSMHKQAMRDGRYAIRNVSEALALRAKVVEIVLEKWLANEVIIVDVADNHTKAKGLKVVKWID